MLDPTEVHPDDSDLVKLVKRHPMITGCISSFSLIFLMISLHLLYWRTYYENYFDHPINFPSDCSFSEFVIALSGGLHIYDIIFPILLFVLFYKWFNGLDAILKRFLFVHVLLLPFIIPRFIYALAFIYNGHGAGPLYVDTTVISDKRYVTGKGHISQYVVFYVDEIQVSKKVDSETYDGCAIGDTVNVLMCRGSLDLPILCDFSICSSKPKKSSDGATEAGITGDNGNKGVSETEDSDDAGNGRIDSIAACIKEHLPSVEPSPKCVTVEFKVADNGRISGLQLAESLSPEVDKALMEAIRGMKIWDDGQLAGGSLKAEVRLELSCNRPDSWFMNYKMQTLRSGVTDIYHVSYSIPGNRCTKSHYQRKNKTPIGH